MILTNRTQYVTADLEAIILAALHEADITAHAREHVHVVYGRDFSGFCRFPWSTWATASARGRRCRKGHAGARMVLRVPKPGPVAMVEGATCMSTFDVQLFVWLVRHEVGHWRGLQHPQMHPLMRWRDEWQKAGRPLPEWAATMRVAVDKPAAASPRKLVTDDDRAKRLAHARAMLARAERRAKLAATIEKRWARRVSYAERAIDRAASRPKRST